MKHKDTAIDLRVIDHYHQETDYMKTLLKINTFLCFNT